MGPKPIQRLRLVIQGAVQGVGFRPFVYRLAQELALKGWVCNTSSGVLIEVEGEAPFLLDFYLRVGKDCPEHAVIQGMEPVFMDPLGYEGFVIRESQAGEINAWILPDIATCPECRREISDPSDRRYRYPFTNCTHCGPRYSIIERLPYDRVNTSMKKFVMCPECSCEYHDPKDRRFHAQPNACPACGPQLQLWGADGTVLSDRDRALTDAGDFLKQGRILAVKGIGGFHLMADARSDAAVSLLRQRKRRIGKPFALMFPDMGAVRAVCEVDPLEGRLLSSPESPIVLLRWRDRSTVSVHVAPGNPYLGVMLPYAPLHLLLMKDLAFPLVATSGNLSEETICVDEVEAVKRLKGIADYFLVHDRPIVRPVDDSVARVMLDKEQLLRRARGYAPLPILVSRELPPVLAVGAQLKDCVALAKGKNVFISQHIGDLETAQSLDAFQRTIKDLKDLYKVEPRAVACDLHPDYDSARAAHAMGLPVILVQHHQAHVLACVAENEIKTPVLGIAWDGSGYGLDGTVWGGEFFLYDGKECRRYAHFAPIYLPGGETAVREPRRSLLGALYASYGDRLFDTIDPLWASLFNVRELDLLRQIFTKKLNCPMTSSVGRIFDAVAALVGIGGNITFEGQAAMSLEFALPQGPVEGGYSFRISKGQGNEPFVVHAPVWDEIFFDVRAQVPAGVISAKFHHMLCDIIVWAAKQSGMERVALTGGCFQNRYLTERAAYQLTSAGFKAYWHQRVPPNDGGIALGQIMAASQDL